MLVIILLVLVIVLVVKVTRLQDTVDMFVSPNKQCKRPDVPPELLEELKYLKSAGLNVTAESKLKSLGFTSAEAHAFILSL